MTNVIAGFEVSRVNSVLTQNGTIEVGNMKIELLNDGEQMVMIGNHSLATGEQLMLGTDNPICHYVDTLVVEFEGSGTKKLLCDKYFVRRKDFRIDNA
jgi:hypothetical protein